MNLLHYSVIQSLEDVDPDEWNALGGIDNPFVSYEFLAALERHDCVGETFGWYPHFVVGHDEAGHLRAAMPMYAKNNSYGEFVFDWSWADAWERNG
ncbi:MAG: peptidogalycan biosysnthesis protein, partial [Gammaproteobacteria bacterium]